MPAGETASRAPAVTSGDRTAYQSQGQRPDLICWLVCRAGGARVTAVESVRHLAETATSVVAVNGFSATVGIVHKDGRYLRLGEEGGKGQMKADMEAPADLLAFEVFDCGLIGEGALHIVAAARSNLLRPGARILPAAGKVYCQPIQHQRQAPSAVADILDPSPLQCYSWQPDYFEVDLKITCNKACSTAASPPHTASCLSTAAASAGHAATGPAWQALAPPQLAFEFDFNSPESMEAFQPASKSLVFQVQQAGLLNAVAFWFELQLDDSTSLSSSPYAQQLPDQASTTWKQAVQLLPEHAASPGQQLHITASHDTYAISFAIGSSNTSCSTDADISSSRPLSTNIPTTTSSASTSGSLSPTTASGVLAPPQPTGVPFADPAWKSAHDALTQLQGNLVKALTQDPLEYRRLVSAAMLLAMRPWGSTHTARPAGELEPVAAGTSPETEGHAAEAEQQQQQRQFQQHNRVQGSLNPLGAPAGSVNNNHSSRGSVHGWPVADAHHAAALLVRLMT